jgi:hypothetical protein
MDDSKEKKIYFIQSKINTDKSNKYYNIIYTFINENKLEYTTNKNGIFFNLSSLDTTIIDKIYSIFLSNQDSGNVNKKIVNYVKKVTVIDEPLTIKKDKLCLDKFDKYILQLSRTNIHQ